MMLPVSLGNQRESCPNQVQMPSCRISVKDHFGPHGEGKCLHNVAAFRAQVEGLEADLKADRTEARDQEQRIKVRITALEGEVRQKKK